MALPTSSFTCCVQAWVQGSFPFHLAVSFFLECCNVKVSITMMPFSQSQ